METGIAANGRVDRSVRGWMPIEAAPKDGRKIWLFDPNDHQCVGYWFHCANWEGWMFADELLADVKPDGLTPTHWMPLPDAPNAI
jgi:hypothetical protein